MTFEDQLERYFGTRDPSSIAPQALASAVERMKVDLGLATDSGARFAIWCMLFMFGSAPDIDRTFADRAERDLARQFMEKSEAAAQQPDGA
ncbi:hypothetical protein [Blastomonas aquatica]|uniref:Extradiol ring-cleavage dioxygenase LigAB LigA subunit domain-containing protein n=1 Tax=Blastomonas aquatica TaxID=1510276 RepID=A0ABQ1JKP5_9SPHN|nr:hypothetical protein [Blastomonas aquatica]GGB69175.1 hypothetical protein GCM10010833_25490 [Blastomonas aquatica]